MAYFPAGQLPHDTCAERPVYVWTGHGVHDADPAADWKCPAEQSTHAPWPALAWCRPTGQLVHELCPP